MTTTDELRRLLDGRGVEWVAIGTDTCWTGADGYPMRAWETTNGTHMRVADLTPEQAVEATLGRGTCHETIIDHHWRGCCSCGYIWEFMYGIGKCERPHYCPNCGRKVVDA